MARNLWLNKSVQIQIFKRLFYEKYITPSSNAVEFYAEDTLLNGSKTIKMNDTGVNVDASLSEEREWDSPNWDVEK